MTELRRRLLAGALALALVAGACGSGDDTEADAAPVAAAAPTSTEAPAPTAEADAPPPTGDAPADESATTTETADPEIVRFATPDGEELEGTVYGTGATGVVLAHMRGRDRSTWTDFAKTAAAAGHQVLTFDFRGYGGSSGERDTALDVDLIAAVELLRLRGVQRTVIMGASMGGTAVVNVASRIETAGAVSLSAPADFIGLPALAVVGDVAEPLLLVTAEGDQPYADAAVEMDGLAPASQLTVFSGNAHGTNLFGDHGDALTELLLSFIADRSA